ncbi:MAG TPA: hypothetical protein VJK53_02545 [Candidatus Paceibacterota bacterium]
MAKKVTIETLAAQMRRFDKRLDTFVTLMVEGFDQLNTKIDDHRIETNEKILSVANEVHEIREDIKEMKPDIVEIKADQAAHGKAIDKDAVTLINHEGRIKKLEHAR